MNRNNIRSIATRSEGYHSCLTGNTSLSPSPLKQNNGAKSCTPVCLQAMHRHLHRQGQITARSVTIDRFIDVDGDGDGVETLSQILSK